MGTFSKTFGVCLAQQGAQLSLLPEYKLVFDAMVAVGATPDAYDKFRQQRLLTKFVEKGYYAKSEYIDIFGTQKGGSLINWKSPGIFNPSAFNDPQFIQYSGYNALGESRGIDFNFNIVTDATICGTSNICAIIGIASSQSEDLDDFGALQTTRFSIRARHSTNRAYWRCNGSSFSVENSDAVKHIAMSKSNSTNLELYLNKDKTTVVDTGTSAPNHNLLGCGYWNGSQFVPTTKRLRYAILTSYLTDAEIYDIIDIMEEYFEDYNMNIVDYTKWLDQSSKIEIPLTTYDGSGTAAHPSVLILDNPISGYKYWMANTPLAGVVASDVENPSIWASSDGITWVVPPGLTNPVIPKPIDGYNADVDIAYNDLDGKLYMIWKEATQSSGVLIKICNTSDGITWENVKTLLTPNYSGQEITCPSLVKIGSKWYIYYFDYFQTRAGKSIHRMSCDTIDGVYGNDEILSLPKLPNYNYWHFDVDVINGLVYLIATVYSNTGGAFGENIVLFKSTDGITFNGNPRKPINYITKSYEERGFHRPTIVEDSNGDILVYYAKRGLDAIINTARLKISLPT